MRVEMSKHSKLVRMRIQNIGSIGPESLEVELDNILCLVGVNNCGKSTVLRAYELAVGNKELKPEDVCKWSNDNKPSVEIWVHIPKGMPNIDEKWKQVDGELLLVRSKWEWEPNGSKKPTRTTWNPETNDYDPEGNAAGLDTVFSSRLPKPIRINSLESPEEEQGKLMGIIVDPIAKQINAQLEDETTELSKAQKTFLHLINSSVNDCNDKIQSITTGIHNSYSKVFPNISLRINIELNKFKFEPSAELVKGSSIKLMDGNSEVTLQQQGTGSQRALFWSMLQIRHGLVSKLYDVSQKKPAPKKKGKQETPSSDNKVEEQDLNLPGYMLLIDEPENALHPNAIRAARDYLYELAEDPQWQVMLSTHSPYFINPLEDHTTIVRLERNEKYTTPKTYKSDEIKFTADEKENLKMLLQMDPTLSEMFFGCYTVVVEGDTEYAAFKAATSDIDDHKYDKINVIRARGKEIIPTIVKMLAHFKVSFSVLHDTDSPCTSKGKANTAWSANMRISNEICKAKQSGLSVIHCSSVPNFELRHLGKESSKDKPWKMYKAVIDDPKVKSSVLAAFEALLPSSSVLEHICFDDLQNHEKTFKNLTLTWLEKNPDSLSDVRYQFSEIEIVKD